MNYRCDEDVYFLLEYFDIRSEWDYWATRPVLLADEAIPLMHGVDPASWQEYLRNEKGLPDGMTQSIGRCLRIVENAVLKQASPAEWLKWGCEHKLNEHTLKPDYTLNTGEVCLWHLFEDALKKTLTDHLHAKPAAKSFGNKWEDPSKWEYEARKIGEEYFKKNPSEGVVAIAAYVEGELSNRNILGTRGKYLDRETIKREALTGITRRKPNGRK